MKKTRRKEISVLFFIALIPIVICLVVLRGGAEKGEQPSTEPYIAYSRGGPESNEPIYILSVADLECVNDPWADKLTSDQLLVLQATRYTLQHKGYYLFLDKSLVTEDIIGTAEIIMLCSEVEEVGYTSFQITGREVSGVLFCLLTGGDSSAILT